MNGPIEHRFAPFITAKMSLDFADMAGDNEGRARDKEVQAPEEGVLLVIRFRTKGTERVKIHRHETGTNL